jgi:nucleoid-associated protein YgaU
MGSVAVAVLEFDEAVQVPWRPRLVDVSSPPAPTRGLASAPPAQGPAVPPPGRRPHATRAGRVGAASEEVSLRAGRGTAGPASGRQVTRRSATQGSRRTGGGHGLPSSPSPAGGVGAGRARPGFEAAAPGFAAASARQPSCPRCVDGEQSLPVRLTDRARRLLTGLVVAVAIAAGACVGGLVAGDEPVLELVGETSVVVQPGDTVWDIARSVAGDDQDVRAVVDAIERRNDLVAGRLVPGQVLVLP